MNRFDRSWPIAKTILFIMAAALQVTSAGISTAESYYQERDVVASAGLDPKAVRQGGSLKRSLGMANAGGFAFEAATQRYVPGEIIVKLKPMQTDQFLIFSETRSATAQRFKATVLRLQADYELHSQCPVFAGMHRRTTPEIDRLAYYLLKTERNVWAICAELNDDPEVEYAQPNYIYRICREPNDPDFPDQYAHQLIQMSEAWDISTGSRDVVVAVLDTGVDINHPDLKDNMWKNQDEIPDNGIDDDKNGYIDDVNGWNFGDSNNQVKPENGADYSIAGHGTQVAGVIAAVGNNGKGVAGVNWQCSIMPLRLSLDITSAEVAAALDYAAANGAHVANMSFGAYAFGPDGDPIVKEAIDSAFAGGVLLVASAGNDDTIIPHYPAAYYNVMAVASTDGEDFKTGHSSFGSWVDIAAPGTDIVTTDLNNQYISTAGTSFSAPYVAAVGALLLSHRAQLSHVQVRAVLENTTDPVYYGDIDPNRGYVGTGRVNAYQALLAADRKHPLGEIVEPRPQQTFAPDVNDIPILLFIQGDFYQLEYRGYEDSVWVPISQGSSPSDPNGLVRLSLINPGIGAFDLRLSVTTDGYTHTDCKTFGMEFAPNQTPWPMPQKVQYPPEQMFISSPMCLDIDGDSRNEIIQASITWSGGKINIWKENGTSLPGWPKVLGSYLGFSIPSALAVGDIDGDSDYEIIAVDVWNSLVYAWHVQTGNLVDGNWPVSIGTWYAFIVANPVLADLDGDGDSEIIVALDEESRDTDGLYAIQGDGTFLWQRRYTSEGPVSVADFDKDGDVEIALCGYGPGLTRVYTFILDHQGQQIKRWRGGSKKGTAIADIDADGNPELVFCTEDSVKAVHLDGSTLWTADIRDPFGDAGALSIADINGDGYSEVYVNSLVEAHGFAFSLVYAFDHKARQLTDAGFPKTILGYPVDSSPLIGDIDGDGQKELVVGSAGAPIMAWEQDGSATPGFPMLNLSTEIGTAPALEDLDQDGDLEMIVSGYDYRFHVIDLPGRYDPNMFDWSMSRHDPQNSGWTLASPKLQPMSAPAELKPGQRIELHITTWNPANLPVRLTISNLPEGAYFDADTQTVFWKPATDQVFHTFTISFLVTDGIRQHRRSVSIAVVPDAIYYTNMDTDPNWHLDVGWAWGVPKGQGSWNGDPNSGYTGDNVVGYKLDGDYENFMAETRYAMTGAINCEGYSNIRLSFRRWLGVESPYDRANIQISNDGTNWVDIWTTGYSHISDENWQFVEYEVPTSIADNQPTVYFRWGIGPTDDSVTYPGWNIDDVQVTGDRIQ